MIPITQIVFCIFAILLVIGALAVILVRNPVHSVLCLVLCFFCASVLWLLLQAEFIGLVLIFVYVGAVMTLFLFVVMMLNIDTAPLREGFVRYLPIGALVLLIFAALLTAAIVQYDPPAVSTVLPASNIQALGQLLFTDYLYPFELAGVMLLAAIIAAIRIAFYGKKPDSKVQVVRDQHAATKANRLKIVKGN